MGTITVEKKWRGDGRAVVIELAEGVFWACQVPCQTICAYMWDSKRGFVR